MSQGVRVDELLKALNPASRTYGVHFAKHENDPILMYIIENENHLQVFKNLSKNKMVMSYPWYIRFFEKTSYNCENPDGNPFNLLINSRVIVKCPFSNMIRKYYSVEGNSTTVRNLSLWTLGKTLTLPKNHGILQSRKWYEE